MGTRWLLVLVAAVAALALAVILLGWPITMREPSLTPALLLAFLVTLLATALGLELLVRAPLRKIVRSFDRTHGNATTELDTLNSGEFAALAKGIARLHRQLNAARDEAARLTDKCREAEQALRESEQRYEMAVKGANDGMFEWDLKSGRVFYSPRWKSMLGYRDSEVGEDIEDWYSRTHPDDIHDVRSRMQDHLEGRTGRFESEHRLRCRDNTYLWVFARATAIRRATGSPYRVVGLHTDVSSRRSPHAGTA